MRLPSFAPRKPVDALSRDLTAWGLLAAAVLLMLMAAPLLAGRDYLRDDLAAYHYPLRAFYAEQLTRGEAFDWMPSLFCGFYLTGEGQAGTYHPWHWLLYRLLPLHAATGAEWLGSYAALFAGTWLLLRRRTGRSEVAAFGALVFAFGSFNLLHFVHPNAIAVIAHLPWLLWAADIVLRDARRLRVALGQLALSLLTGSQLLLGYPQYVWFSLLTLTVYVAYTAISRQYEPPDGCEQQIACAQCVGCTRPSWARVAIAVGVGLLVGGVQLLPTVDALAQSARRTADPSFALWGSLHPLNLLQLVSPYFFTHRVAGANTHELGLYLGAAPLLLAVWAVVHWRRMGQRGPLVLAAAVFGGVALLLAFGQYTPLGLVQSWFPFVRSFRFPCRFIVLFQLAAAVLAALGFMLLIEQCRRAAAEESCRSWRSWFASSNWRPAALRQSFEEFRPVYLVVVIAVTIAAVGLVLQGDESVAAPVAVWIGPLLVVVAALMFAFAVRGHATALVALVLFTAADLGAYGLSYAIYPPQEALATYKTSIPQPPSATDDRVVCDFAQYDAATPHTGNELTLLGWQRADGYAGLEPLRPLDLREIPALQSAGVRWVRHTPEAAAITGLRPVSSDWLEVPGPLPRFRFDTGTNRQAVPIDEITVRVDRPGHIEVAVAAAQAQRLVIAESFHQGWQASIDGEPTPLVATDDGFLAVELGPGKRHVSLDFQPWSLRLGWFNTLLGLGLTGLVFATAVVGPLRSTREVSV